MTLWAFLLGFVVGLVGGLCAVWLLSRMDPGGKLDI